MTVREIINSLEVSKKALEDENKLLKSEIEELKKINKKLVDELNSYKDTMGVVHEEVEYEKKNPSDDENASKIEVEEVEPQITSIVTNVDGKVSASIIEGSSISIDDVAEKPKRSRKKKVEPVEEPIENV